MAALHEALEKQGAGNRSRHHAGGTDVQPASAILRSGAGGRVHAQCTAAARKQRLRRAAHLNASILDGFAQLSIDASSEDGTGGTSETQFREKISRWEKLEQPAATETLLRHLNHLHAHDIAQFVEKLDASLHRRVVSVRLTVLRGHTVECHDIQSAISYLIDEENSSKMREDGEQREAFEVQVRFNTAARIDATFTKRAEAIGFLRTFA